MDMWGPPFKRNHGYYTLPNGNTFELMSVCRDSMNGKRQLISIEVRGSLSLNQKVALSQYLKQRQYAEFGY